MDRQSSAVLHRNLQLVPQKVIRAKGSYIFLEDGQRLLDSTGGAAVCCVGHGHEKVKDAIKKQMDEISYTHSLFFSTSAYEELAAFLTESTGGKLPKVYIANSGSEAMEAAMKLARQYFLELPTPQPQRKRFIARKHSFHGVTLGSLSMGGHVFRRELFKPILLDNVSHVSPCNSYRGKEDGESDAEYVARLAAELDAEFNRVGADSVCAFVAEPVVGAALGCVPAVAGYFQAMKGICDKYGALLILDEVMSGMGRSGTLHAWEQEGVVPDIQTIGKGLGGGYAAVSGILIGNKVVDVLDKGTGAFRHGQTYQGHPVGCAAALAVQKVIKEENLLENVREMGALLEARLREYLDDHPNVGNIRGKGLFWGVEFVKDKVTKEPFDPKLAVNMKVQALALDPKYSFSIYGGAGTKDGISGDHALLAPPYNSTKEEIEEIAKLTAAVVKEVFTDLGASK
ncbi:aminotransferase [Arthroderma uncinatum]|uniref:aminotransferase n=1 Tax=Arthroderma uncinatum TaxID=74035 RepID=UPI00144A9B1F|nr:aminotransferase [Arthroderma uncinatum]KAF3481059.1 aminotransferase [Arthroderma uncinatum]